MDFTHTDRKSIRGITHEHGKEGQNFRKLDEASKLATDTKEQQSLEYILSAIWGSYFIFK
jgi:hypothetical protein